MTKLNELREYYDNTDTADDLDNATAEPADAPPEAERMTAFSVRMPLPLLEQVRAIAAERGVTTSIQIRELIEAGMSAERSEAEPMVPLSVLAAALEQATRGSGATRRRRGHKLDPSGIKQWARSQGLKVDSRVGLRTKTQRATRQDA